MQAAEVRYIVLHCSATRADHAVTLEDIDAWHRARGWNGCGYHYVIERDGQLRAGRALNRVGAHCKGHNRTSWGVCLVGGLDADGEPEDNFTPEQWASLVALLPGLKQLAPQAEVLGHRDLSPDIDHDGMVGPHEWVKACPCFDVRAWWAREAAILAGRV